MTQPGAFNVAAMAAGELAGRLARERALPGEAGPWRRFARFLDYALAAAPAAPDAAVVLDGRGRVCWACMAIRSAGRTSLVVPAGVPPSRAEREEPRAAMASAVQRLARQELDGGAALIQALLAPQDQAEAGLLESAGFLRLAELIYMDAPLAEPDDPAAAQPLSIYDPGQRDRFEQVIQASYVGTLDCPGLEGLRRMEDVLASHRGSGRFRPDLWFLYGSADAPAGVVLLNEIAEPAGESLELVYMGLTPESRGRGLGRRMLLHAMAAGRRAGFARVSLAVDSSNVPALRLYRGQGFCETMRRLAMIYSPDRTHTGSDVAERR